MSNKTVEMIAGITGTRDGQEWPRPGELLTCTAEEADHLIAAGLAKTPESVPVTKKAETAAAPKGETRKGLTKSSMK